MENFIRKNIGFLAFYFILIGGVLLINVRFSEPINNQNKILILNK